ncbi:MAG: DinB family protein [Acidobacteriaceae bacterium]|nr:DinB family protein [Acidobacteriaceae bacterium]
MEIGSVETFLEYFSKIRERTMRLVACIPEDKVEWRAAAGKFTLGDVARHIAATERNVFVECACGGHNRYAGCGPELAGSRDEIIEFMQRMHRESVKMLAQLTPAQLQQRCQTPDGTPITTWKLLRSMIEHEVHHRGELYAYLGVLGVTVPPLYGVTSEQLKQFADRATSVANSG